jgi:hypothetical protein
MALTRPTADRFVLSGTLDGAQIAVTLRLVRAEDFPLMKAKFRWVGR